MKGSSVEDMQGRFNLNQVVKPEGDQLIKDPLWACAALSSCWSCCRWNPSGPTSKRWTGSTATPRPNFRRARKTMSTRCSTRPIEPPIHRWSAPANLLARPEFGLERYRKIRPLRDGAADGHEAQRLQCVWHRARFIYSGPRILAAEARAACSGPARKKHPWKLLPAAHYLRRGGDARINDPAKGEIQNALSENTDLSGRPSSSPLALRNSPCTVCCAASLPALFIRSCAASAPGIDRTGDTLVIRICGPNLTEQDDLPASWLVVDDSGRALGSVQAGPLAEAAH